ncbi:MAG: HlyD family efflux transporter periplasmic adaptor subunit [Pseudanabaenaceae cyanobacterium]
MKKWWWTGTTSFAMLTTIGFAFFHLAPKQQTVVASVPEEPIKVVALGRLEPASGVVNVSVPSFLANDRVAVLRVKEGDRVEKGDVIALLESHWRLQALQERAKQQVEVARAKLRQVQAGAKQAEIEAQTAEIQRLRAQLAGELAEQEATLARLTAEVQNAQREYERYQALVRDDVVSQSLADSKLLTLQTARANLEQAKSGRQRVIATLQAQIAEAEATKRRLVEVRPVDVAVAEAELREAEANLRQITTDLGLSIVRSPVAGEVLKIHSYPGEVVSSQGIVEVGSTDRMVAVAEVYQSDIGRVAVGQTATVTGEAFPGAVQGKVTAIGLQVERQTILSGQPGEKLDRRVIEVKVALDPDGSKRVRHLNNLQVVVAIEP